MERTALAVCEILKYLIIHWRCETETSKGALLEGQLVISIEALNSKHQPNALHCVTTIASVRSICGGLVLKKFLKEIQSILRAFSAKLIWTSEENSCFRDTSGVTPFQMTFEINERPRALMIDCLVIKQFLHKIIIVHHKIRFTLSVKVNGFLSTEIFGIENEPTLNLSNGITIVVNCQHYVRFENHFCPTSAFFRLQKRLPLTLSNEDQLSTTVFKDTFYFIDWKKYHLCVVPNLDLNLDKDLVLPDVSYQVESSERDQSQIMHLQGQTLLLFLFVDFHSGFPVQQTEIWGVHTLLTAHLSAILMESHTVIQDSIHFTLDQILEQRDQAAKAHQKLQASLSVAVGSIMSVVTGSTSGSFRKTCLQALQAADTQEFGTKLHKIFCDITQHRFLHHCSSNVKQLIPEKNNSAQSTEDAHESGSPELLAEISRQAQRKRPKSDSLRHGQEETLAFITSHREEPPDAFLTPREEEARTDHDRAPAPERASPGSGLEDALWLQEVSNLSEWLSPGSGS